MYFSQIAFPNVPDVHFIRVKATFVTPKTCKYQFALSVCGKARLLINGKEIIDLWTDHPEKTDDTPCFNKLSMERYATVDAQKGQSYDLVILMTNLTLKGALSAAPGGIRLGGQELRNEDQAINNAVELAKNVDIPIIIAGLSSDYEYEGSDRQDLLLPGRQNEMIQRVCDANRNTVRYPKKLNS